MRTAREAKDAKSKKNARLKELSKQSCDGKITARIITVNKASTPRHIVYQENDRQNFDTKSIARKSKRDYVSREVYQFLDKLSDVKCYKDSEQKELKGSNQGKSILNEQGVHTFLDTLYEVKCFEDSEQKELKGVDQEKGDLSDQTFRKAQVRLDFQEKHESEKLKTDCLERTVPDWLFQYTPASPVGRDLVVHMMQSGSPDEVEFHVPPPAFNRDSGYQGSNAPTEELVEKKVYEISDDEHTRQADEEEREEEVEEEEELEEMFESGDVDGGLSTSSDIVQGRQAPQQLLPENLLGSSNNGGINIPTSIPTPPADVQSQSQVINQTLGHQSQLINQTPPAGHQEQQLQQSLQRVTGGNRDLARQFLSHLINNTVLSLHCGVILCRALQTVVGRGCGGTFTSGGQYVVVSEVGRGGYGIVHRCEAVIVNGDRLESVEFVRKRMLIRRFHVQEARVYIDYGERLPWMLDFLGIVRDGDNVDLFFEYAAGGSLAQWIERSPRLEIVDSIGRDTIFNQMYGIIYQLLRCTSDFNRQQVAHWDIKAWNVLFTTSDCQGSSVVLVDTGSTKVWADIQHSGIQSLDGTLIFCPPECEEVCVCPEDFLDLELCDAWEVGATIYHLLTGQHLWVQKKHEFRTTYQQNWHKHMRKYIVCEGWRVCELINNIDQSQHRLVTPLVFVLSLLLEYDVCLRRTATEVLDLPVFSGMREQHIPSSVAEIDGPPVHVPPVEDSVTIPQCRAGRGRRFPENPYLKLTVIFGNTPIYVKYFRGIQGFRLHHLATNAEFLRQLELHVPNFERGYSLLCHTRETISGQFVLMNVGRIDQDTVAYLTTP